MGQGQAGSKRQDLMKRKRLLLVLTAVNVLLLLVSVFCLVRTEQNNKYFNSTNTDFDYYECGNGKAVLTLHEDKEITLIFGDKSVKVVDAYQTTGKEEVVSVVMFIREYTRKHGLELKRSNTQIMGEYRLHNLLYLVGYKREQTGDADVDYVSDSRWY
ncbi:MAG: hypothetical protein ACI4VK_01410, partial [Candidatus Coproplasma sp.]